MNLDSRIGRSMSDSKNFQFVVIWEVLVFYGKESVSDIGADIFAELGVIPEYVVLLTVFLFVSYGWLIM